MGFGDDFKRSVEQAKQEAEREKVVIGDQNVKVLPANQIWGFLFKLLLFVIIIAACVILLSSKIMPGASAPTGLMASIRKLMIPYRSLAMMVGGIALVPALAIYILFLKPPRFDRWVRDIARKRLSCDYIFFRGQYLFINYDVGLNRNDIRDFVREISDKSEHFSYYLDNIDIDGYCVTIAVARKQIIPRRCDLAKSDDRNWNIIPLGLAVNDPGRCVSPVGWWLNDEQKDESMVPTLPSNSMMIAGGTGSGKSVVENGIIGHITRNADHIQGLLCDVKRVEFGGLEVYRGIKKVALSIEEVEELLTQAQKIMMQRFKFMETHGVNNIYKLKSDVDWFEIGGKRYQFDEIISAKIDGAQKLVTMDEVYDAVQAGKDVEIDDIALIDE